MIGRRILNNSVKMVRSSWMMAPLALNSPLTIDYTVEKAPISYKVETTDQEIVEIFRNYHRGHQIPDR